MKAANSAGSKGSQKQRVLGVEECRLGCLCKLEGNETVASLEVYLYAEKGPTNSWFLKGVGWRRTVRGKARCKD